MLAAVPCSPPACMHARAHACVHACMLGAQCSSCQLCPCDLPCGTAGRPPACVCVRAPNQGAHAQQLHTSRLNAACHASVRHAPATHTKWHVTWCVMAVHTVTGSGHAMTGRGRHRTHAWLIALIALRTVTRMHVHDAGDERVYMGTANRPGLAPHPHAGGLGRSGAPRGERRVSLVSLLAAQRVHRAHAAPSLQSVEITYMLAVTTFRPDALHCKHCQLWQCLQCRAKFLAALSNTQEQHYLCSSVFLMRAAKRSRMAVDASGRNWPSLSGRYAAPKGRSHSCRPCKKSHFFFPSSTAHTQRCEGARQAFTRPARSAKRGLSQSLHRVASSDACAHTREAPHVSYLLCLRLLPTCLLFCTLYWRATHHLDPVPGMAT